MGLIRDEVILIFGTGAPLWRFHDLLQQFMTPRAERTHSNINTYRFDCRSGENIHNSVDKNIYLDNR